MIGTLTAPKTSEMVVIPKTLKVTQSSVLSERQAISLASAVVRNIATQIQLRARHPSSVMRICEPMMAPIGFIPISRPLAMTAASRQVSTVGLILMNSSLSK